MYKINRKAAFPIQYSRTKKSKYSCHPPFHPPIFCRYSSKLLLPTLPKLMNWILLSPPLLSSDPDNPPNFGTCTNPESIISLKYVGSLLCTTRKSRPKVYMRMVPVGNQERRRRCQICPSFIPVSPKEHAV